jgi:hypothetical protein
MVPNSLTVERRRDRKRVAASDGTCKTLALLMFCKSDGG